MKQFQKNIQNALDDTNMKPYGKLTNLLNNAHRSGLINTKQLEELDANLEQLRLGNNNPVAFRPRCSESSYAKILRGDMAQQFNESQEEEDYFDDQDHMGL